jgi:hypothetical protein
VSKIPTWETLQGQVRSGLLDLIAMDQESMAECKRSIYQERDGVGIIIADGLPARINRRKDGPRTGLLGCSLCSRTRTEHLPCYHIAFHLYKQGHLRPAAPTVNEENAGNQLERRYKRTFDHIRVDVMFDILASLLAAIPKQITAAFRGNGRASVPIPVLAYTTLLCLYRGVTRGVGIAELNDERHRDILKRHFNYEWSRLKVLDQRGSLVEPPHFQDFSIYWFLNHPSTNDYIDLLLALCGVVMREFEDVAQFDGTCEALFLFCQHAEDKLTIMNRHARSRRLASAQRNASPFIQAHVEPVVANTNEVITLLERYAKEGQQQKNDASDDKPEHKGRPKPYLKVIVGNCYRSGIVFAAMLAKPGGEAPYGPPMMIRCIETVGAVHQLMDAGYAKRAAALLAKRLGIHAYIEDRRNEGTEGQFEAKTARARQVALMRANSDYAAKFHGMRANSEGWNRLKDCIIGTTVLSRGPCRKRAKGSPKLKRGAERQHAKKNKILGMTEEEAVRIGNEAKLQQLGVNGYLFARWHTKLAIAQQQHLIRLRIIHQDAADPEAVARTELKRYAFWTADCLPNFKAGAQAYLANPHRTTKLLLERYGGPPSESERAIAKDFPQVAKARTPEAAHLLE